MGDATSDTSKIMEIKITHDITFFQACSQRNMWRILTKWMEGRKKKEGKKERSKNEDQRKWRNEGTNKGMIDGMKEWRNESMTEPMMEGKEPHHLIRTTTCYFFNRPCKDSFISTWLTLSVSTGKIWHILRLGQISIIPLFKVSLLGSLLIFMFFSVFGVSWHLSNFLNISFGNQPKQKITISESEKKKERTTSTCLEINRDILLEILIPKFLICPPGN